MRTARGSSLFCVLELGFSQGTMRARATRATQLLSSQQKRAKAQQSVSRASRGCRAEKGGRPERALRALRARGAPTTGAGRTGWGLKTSSRYAPRRQAAGVAGGTHSTAAGHGKKRNFDYVVTFGKITNKSSLDDYEGMLLAR